MNNLLNILLQLLKGNVSSISLWLAKIFDRLKLNNPTTAIFVIALLTGVNVLFSECAVEILCANEWLKTVGQVISALVLGLVGSRTTRFIEAEKQQLQSKEDKSL